MTNDVETTSIVNNCLSIKTGERVLNEGMPKLLNAYDKWGIKSTFFFTGYIAENYPEIVRMIQNCGHEIGCHGYSHEVDKGFDLLNYDQQIECLRKAKDILENISGEEVISFRAPALRVNNYTPAALIETGFKIDSSTSSQRMDMFFSHGSKKKLNWIIQPRLPYFTNYENIWKKGKSQLYEIPISALFLPYIGTLMRISPGLTTLLRKVLDAESGINNKPVVFLIHPNELINECKDEEFLEQRKRIRTDNIVSYYLKNVLRRNLKLKNLGNKAVFLLENEIEYFIKKNYQFSTLKEYFINSSML